MLWSIAYCSRTRLRLSEAEIAGLAIHAQARNETLSVTGTLFMAGGHFVQILEGDREPVTWLYEVIVADQRHRDVLKILDAPLDRRAFEGWAMRLLTTDDLAAREREIVIDTLRSHVGEAGAPPPIDASALVSALATGVVRPWRKPTAPPPPSAA